MTGQYRYQLNLSPNKMAVGVGLEPTSSRLTAERLAIRRTYNRKFVLVSSRSYEQRAAFQRPKAPAKAANSGWIRSHEQVPHTPSFEDQNGSGYGGRTHLTEFMRLVISPEI